MRQKEKIIVVAGKFDALHGYDVDLLRRAKGRGDWLIVGVYSDEWMANYNKGFLHSQDTRIKVLSSMRYVDEVFRFKDKDGTACNLLKLVKIVYPNSDITFITESDIQHKPETKIKGITFEVMKQE
jgi:cytidyltransferase-like protein